MVLFYSPWLSECCAILGIDLIYEYPIKLCYEVILVAKKQLASRS